MKMNVTRWFKYGDKEEWRSIGRCDIEYDHDANIAKIIFPAHPQGKSTHTINVFELDITGDLLSIVGTIKTSERTHELFKAICTT